MNKLIIRELSEKDEKTFYEARQAWDNSPGFMFSPRYVEGMPFSQYVLLLQNQRNGKELPPNFVADTSLYGFLNEKIVGRVSIRHELNDHLKMVGGHIGYGVLPSFRGQGIAKQLLIRALEEAKNLNIKSVLFTCDETNLASVKLIEKAGGILENVLQMPDGKPGKKRYWIKLI